MKSVCCLALLICHIELEFQKSTAVNLRNPLRSLWLSIAERSPQGLGVNENAGAASLFIQASLLLFIIIVIWNCGVFLSLEWACRYARRDFCSTLDRMLSSSNRFSPSLAILRSRSNCFVA